MVYIKMRVRKEDLINPIQNLQDQQLPDNGKSNRILLVAVILVGIIFASVFAWTIKLQHSQVKRVLLTIEEAEILAYNFSMLQKESPVVSCYYDMPNISTYNNTRQLMPSDIHPHLCTHINVAFGKIINKEIHLDEYQLQIIPEVVKLKETNPKLKVLLSVGGAGDHSGFSDMVVNHISRKIFIKSVKYTLKNLSLDGIDLDWEFPAIESENNISKRDRQHFSQLLREIRMEYVREKRNYLLTVAVAAPKIIVDAAYDVDQINIYADFVNIMTYDLHSYTDFTPMTGLNSPLYSRSTEDLYMATLNINYTVNLYKSKGLDANKIVVGIPTYGHSFTLVNKLNVNVGSPALGFGNLGNLGFVDYPDICTFLNDYKNETTIIEEINAKVPYFYRNTEWVSYDNPKSVTEKAKFIKDNKLRGAMIYSLNADDYDGICDTVSGLTKFPLAASVKNIINQM